MDILEFHNKFRQNHGLSPLIPNEILTNCAYKQAKWMARRKFYDFWNFDKIRGNLISEYNFKDVEFNLGLADQDWMVMNELMKDSEAKLKIFGDFTYIGFGNYKLKFTYWVILYAK